MIRTFSCPPALWAEVEAWIPTSERSAFIQQAFKREVARRKRQRTPQADAFAEEGYRALAEESSALATEMAPYVAALLTPEDWSDPPTNERPAGTADSTTEPAAAVAG